MPELQTLLLFLSVSVVLTLAPGPDILFLITQGVTRGVRAGLATAMGLALGNLAHTLAAALGLALVFQQNELAFQALKFAGVAYLLYLAWMTFQQPSVSENKEPEMPAQGLFIRGLLMNILNPKVMLIFLALLPQFVNPELGSVTRQLIVLGLLFTAQVVVVFGSMGVLAGWLGDSFRARFGRSGRFARYLVIMIYLGLALRLALVEA
jgi:threonine/homoserine/homoserine lactone efflux protein